MIWRFAWSRSSRGWARAARSHCATIPTSPQKIVALQISSSLNWRSIRVDGKPVQFVSQPYVSDIDHTGALSEAIVTLPAEIKPKDSVELEIGYEGVIPLDATRLTQSVCRRKSPNIRAGTRSVRSFTAVRGAGYVAWYPITTESADFSEGNSLFEVSDRWKAREAGSEFKSTLSIRVLVAKTIYYLLRRRREQRARWRRLDGLCYNCDCKPLGTITPIFAIANYGHDAKPPLYLSSLSGHEAGAATYSNALDPAMKFVTGWFGQPASPVAIADLADPNSAPFESGTLLLASMVAEDSKLAGINLVHELVHSALPSSRPWVYEGLAHFAEAMYRAAARWTRGGTRSPWTCTGQRSSIRKKKWRLRCRKTPGRMKNLRPTAGHHLRRNLLSQQSCVRVVDAARHGRRRCAQAGHWQVSGRGRQRSKYVER